MRRVGSWLRSHGSASTRPLHSTFPQMDQLKSYRGNTTNVASEEKRLQLHVRWVRRHTGDVENTIADRLADCGTLPELQHLLWRRAPLHGGRKEEEFVVQIVGIQMEPTSCDTLYVSCGQAWWTIPDVTQFRCTPSQLWEQRKECLEARKNGTSWTRPVSGAAENL